MGVKMAPNLVDTNAIVNALKGTSFQSSPQSTTSSTTTTTTAAAAKRLHRQLEESSDDDDVDDEMLEGRWRKRARLSTGGEHQLRYRTYMYQRCTYTSFFYIASPRWRQNYRVEELDQTYHVRELLHTFNVDLLYNIIK
jgi:hypothetical protein